MRKFFVSATLLLFSPLMGYSLRLNNDSPHYLKAQILGSDGTKFGETVMGPNSWNDWGIDDVGMEIPDITDSQTDMIVDPVLPFVVHWYCSDGSTFSLCTNVANAALVQASTGQGGCQCKSKEVKHGDVIPDPNYGDFSYPPQLPPEENPAPSEK